MSTRRTARRRVVRRRDDGTVRVRGVTLGATRRVGVAVRERAVVDEVLVRAATPDRVAGRGAGRPERPVRATVRVVAVLTGTDLALADFAVFGLAVARFAVGVLAVVGRRVVVDPLPADATRREGRTVAVTDGWP